MVELKDIQAAQQRLAGYVRRTPLIEANPVKQGIGGVRNLYLKLENLQITGSFKARGAVNKLRRVVRAVRDGYEIAVGIVFVKDALAHGVHEGRDTALHIALERNIHPGRAGNSGIAKGQGRAQSAAGFVGRLQRRHSPAV